MAKAALSIIYIEAAFPRSEMSLFLIFDQKSLWTPVATPA